MHHPAISISMNEIVPTVFLISRIFKESLKQIRNFNNTLDTLTSEISTGSILRSASECVVWKNIASVWKNLSEHNFSPQGRGRRLVGGLDSDTWLENPLLPDLILSEKYVPYEQPTEGNSRSLGNNIAPFTMYTDPPFKPKARDILSKLLKMIILRNRLYFSWIETGIFFP